MMTRHFPKPDWANLGAKMKWMATVTVGASALLGACATSAIGEEADKQQVREIIVADSQIVVSDGDGDSRVVRMVVESDGNGDEETELCVFVPAGDDAGGALSCPGGNVRVFQFGPGHGRQIVVGDEVVDEEEIRRLVEARISEVNARLAEREAWEVEVVERFNSAEYEREMEQLEAEMDALADELEFDFEDSEDLTPEEREEFNREMRRFSREMARFGEEMARLQTEVMAEMTAAMARHPAHTPTPPSPPGAPEAHGMHWFGDGPGHMGRQVIRVDNNGDEHVTIIERLESDDGAPRLVIRTTDPDSVEVIGIDPDDLDEDD